MIDNFRLYDFEEKRLAKLEQKLPVCDCCGERMEEWYEVSFKLQTWRFCEDCIEFKEYEEE